MSRFGAARLDRRSEGLLAVCRACALPNLAGVDGLPRRTRRAQSASRPCRDTELVPAARNPRSLRLSSPSRHARVRSRRAGSRVLGRHHLPGCSPFTTACASALPVSCSSSTKPLVPPVCTSTYDTTEEDRLAGSNGVKNSCGWRGGKGEPGSRAPPCRPCSPVASHDNASASDVTSNATGGPGGPARVPSLLALVCQDHVIEKEMGLEPFFSDRLKRSPRLVLVGAAAVAKPPWTATAR